MGDVVVSFDADKTSIDPIMPGDYNGSDEQQGDCTSIAVRMNDNFAALDGNRADLADLGLRIAFAAGGIDNPPLPDGGRRILLGSNAELQITPAGEGGWAYRLVAHAVAVTVHSDDTGYDGDWETYAAVSSDLQTQQVSWGREPDGSGSVTATFS